MDINELESFKLSDAVSFHEELNPRLWQDEKLDKEVRDQLMLIAEDFVEYLGLDNLKVEDVTISGSNAAYSYTPHSDLDLHVLVDFSKLPDDPVYQELFTAKKTLYNDQHDISVHGVPVELYVQDINQPVQSLGEYSIVHDKWIRIPKKRRANFDEVATKAKYEKLGDLIELALKSKDPKRVADTIALVKRYRKSGLDKAGEFGPENLAYKAVRKQGLVQALYDLKTKLHAEKLSIEEAASRDDALIKIKKLLQTAGRTSAEKENIKRIVSKMMQQWNIDPSEIGVRKPVDPLKAKIAKAAYEKTIAADKFKQEWNRFKQGIFAEEETDEDYHPNAKPRGPEFKPTMPAGTVKVDVSDVYDWYKLGQHISNMKGLGKHDFGKGPPSTILSFGDEDTEHKYIQDLKKTGLTTTDIDPKDPKQPKGMKRQKTDPTYNVNEAPRTFAPQETPIQKLVKEYVFFTSLGNVHIDQRGETAEAKQQLLALVQRLSKDSKTFAGIDKQKMEANRDTILNHIHQMMTYAIPVLKKYLPTDIWDAKRSQVNSVLTAYNNARQINEEQLDETAEENQIINVISGHIADKVMKSMADRKPKKDDSLDIFNFNPYPIDVEFTHLNLPKVNDPLLQKLFNKLHLRVSKYGHYSEDPGKLRIVADYGNYVINLYYPAAEEVAEKRNTSLKHEITSGIAHEIQHGLDDLKSMGRALDDPKKTSQATAQQTDPKAQYQEYLKLPYEINARFQEAALDIAKYVVMPKNDGSKTSQADLPNLIRYAFEKNNLDKIYEKNQREYKRLLTRAYKFFQAELNNPKKVSPAPQSLAKRALNWVLRKPVPTEINEASGYIPSAKEKNDPRFKTALTVDVKPDSIKKNAKAFNWKTSRAGIPPQARPDGKIAEDLMKEWKSFLAEDQQELFPGYDEQHREKRLSNWLAKSWGVQNGKPQTFYHATTKDFDTFNTSGTGFASVLGMSYEVERHGSFFAVDPKFAEDFIEDPNTGQVKEGGRVLPVHLSIQYPIDLRDNALSRMLSDDETLEEFKANDIDLRSIYNHMYETDRWELFDGPEGAEFVENLKKLGFDGAIINESIPNNSNARSGEVWVAFSPNQVKSIHNRGSFSPDDPRLMKENG